MNLSELRTALKERREDYSSSDAKLNRKINQAYLDICSRRKWGWLRREYTANTYGANTVANTVTATNGTNEIGFQAGSLPGPCAIGKRILLSGSFYELISISHNGLTGYLDRAYTGANAGPGNYGTITVVYSDVALPLGAQSILQAALFDGTQTYPLSLDAIRPAAMMQGGKAVSGMPNQCSVVEKEPIPKPRDLISGFQNQVPNSTSAMGLGSVATSILQGEMVPGTYTYWYTNYCKWSGAESPLSEPSQITIEASQSAVCLPNIEARNDYVVRVYRSEVNGSTPYLVRDKYELSINGALVSPSPHDTLCDQYLRTRGPDSNSNLYLRLYPYPSSTYQVHVLYQSEGKAMSADADRPLFDATYTNVLLDGAELLMLSANDEQPRAQHVQQRYEAGIQRMITQDRLNFQQRALVGRAGRRVRGQPNWWYGSLPDYGSGGLGGF